MTIQKTLQSPTVNSDTNDRPLIRDGSVLEPSTLNLSRNGQEKGELKNGPFHTNKQIHCKIFDLNLKLSNKTSKKIKKKW